MREACHKWHVLCVHSSRPLVSVSCGSATCTEQTVLLSSSGWLVGGVGGTHMLRQPWLQRLQPELPALGSTYRTHRAACRDPEHLRLRLPWATTCAPTRSATVLCVDIRPEREGRGAADQRSVSDAGSEVSDGGYGHQGSSSRPRHLENGRG